MPLLSSEEFRLVTGIGGSDMVAHGVLRTMNDADVTEATRKERMPF